MISIDPSKKLQIIKRLKEMLNLGLKESKELTEKLPANIKENISKEEASKIAEDL